MAIFTPHDHKITFRDVWKKLHSVSGLDQKERNVILNYLKPTTDAGGISRQEVKDTFRYMRQQRVLERDDLERAERKIMELF
ncbi:MAG: hypothetical protein AB1465_04805 [Patescibacteria group bacterium]